FPCPLPPLFSSLLPPPPPTPTLFPYTTLFRTHALDLPDQGFLPQRDRGAGRDRRLHQRGGAPAGHRRPPGHRPDAGRLRPDRRAGAAAGGSAAGRSPPDGGPAPSRRTAGRAA